MRTMTRPTTEELISGLHELELPGITLPARQQQLRNALLKAHSARREELGGLRGSIRSPSGGMVGMRTRRLWFAGPAIALLMVAVVYQVALRPVRAAAFVTIQVNPSIELGINRRQAVVSVQGLDDAGKAILATLDLAGRRNRPLEEVLTVFTDRLVAENKIGVGGRVVLTVRAVDENMLRVVQDISDQARTAVTERLATAGVKAEAVGLVVDKDLYEGAVKLGFLPAAYAELIALDLANESVLYVLALAGELGIDNKVFSEEIDTFAAAIEDLRAAGVPEAQTLAVIRAAVEADPSLDEISTITAGIIDLVEAGVPLEQGMAILAMQTDATLKLDPEVFREEVTTLMAALVDLHESGITGDAALAVIRAAAKADPSLEEISTITAGIIDLVEAGVPLEQGMAILAMQTDATLKLDPEVFREEVTTLMAALVDLHESGITGDAALAVIRAAVEADPALEEIDKVTDAVVKLTEGGLTHDAALTTVKEALAQDPTLEKFEEILGIEIEEPAGEEKPDDPEEEKEEDPGKRPG